MNVNSREMQALDILEQDMPRAYDALPQYMREEHRNWQLFEGHQWHGSKEQLQDSARRSIAYRVYRQFAEIPMHIGLYFQGKNPKASLESYARSIGLIP